VLQAYYSKCRDIGRGTSKQLALVAESIWRLRDVDISSASVAEADITFAARESFARAWGISPMEQILLEARIADTPAGWRESE
jgi:hypothetical protein